MAYIKEEINHEEFDIKLEVIERDKKCGEYFEPWKIIELSMDCFSDRVSPKELRKLGRWLIQQGKRIGKEYTSKGRKKTK